MNTLTPDRASELVTAVAALLPFRAEPADLGGWSPQIDLGAHPNPDGTPTAADEHDRAAIDDVHTASEYGGEHEAPVWWFETFANGTVRQEGSSFGQDADPREVAEWIAEQARTAGSPAAGAIPAAAPATQDHFREAHRGEGGRPDGRGRACVARPVRARQPQGSRTRGLVDGLIHD